MLRYIIMGRIVLKSGILLPNSLRVMVGIIGSKVIKCNFDTKYLINWEKDPSGKSISAWTTSEINL